ncbi:MAG: M12 family metallo-peptidase [Patulibacter sp.]|nr:M12 family metallo-peptidase [Patulibacter sp.]
MSRIPAFATTHRAGLVAVSLVAAGVATPAASAADPTGVTATGQLVELHGHTASGAEVDESYALRRGTALTPLAGEQPESLIGQQVAVSDGDGTAPGIQGTAQPLGVSRQVYADENGNSSVLVVLVGTPDAAQPITVDQARSAVFTAPDSVAALYAQQSQGSVHLTGLGGSTTGDVVGPVAVSESIGGCRYGQVGNAVDGALAASGVAVAAYQHVVYVLPPSRDCAWAGLGQMPGSRIWVNGTVDVGVVAHELGHNFGAHHANLLRCTSGGGPVPLSNQCTSLEYGDPFDVMGNAGARLMSSWHRAQIGQDQPSQRISLRGSQTVHLTSSDVPGAGPDLLLVPRKLPGQAITSYLAVELRSSQGPFDTWSSPFSAVTGGVSIRLVPQLAAIEQSNLVDTNPQTATALDAPLAPGTTFSDAAYGIALSTGPVTDGQVDVSVTMPTLVDDVPPSAVPSISVQRALDRVGLTWRAATDDDAVDHYEISRNGVVIGTTPGLAYDDLDPAQAAGGVYGVAAVDRSGNHGAVSRVTVYALPSTVRRPGPGPGTPQNGQTTDPATALGDVELVRWTRHGSEWTLVFRAAHAERITAYVGRRTVARRYAPRLTVRTRLPRGVKRRTIRLVAASGASHAVGSWTLRAS